MWKLVQLDPSVGSGSKRGRPGIRTPKKLQI
uniref:Uncharacterized protein n=1 Tax=Bionectria ochroleuca TaxID=29856 RepID=A0A0B7JQK7_BIOOC